MSPRLLLGLVAAGLRWQLSTLPGALAYRLRPYCWRLDSRHRWTRHRRCLRTPCAIDVRTLGEREDDFELALQQLTARLPKQGGRRG